MRNSRSRSVAASYCRTPIRPKTMTSTRPTATTAASNNSSDSDVMTVASSGQQLESHPRRDTRTYAARAFILRQTGAALHTAFPIPRLPLWRTLRRGFYGPHRAFRESFGACATASGTQRCIAGTRTLATSSASFARCTRLFAANASGPAAGATLSLSFATLQQAGGAAGDRDPSTTTPTHTLVLSSAQIVLDHIELVPASVTCPDADDNDVGNPDGNRTRVSAADDGHDQDHECEEIDQGPALVDLPVGQSVVTMFDVPVPAGTYASLEARLESAQANTAAGAAFDAAHPDLAGASVRVTGTFDGTPFIYTGRPRSHLEFRF